MRNIETLLRLQNKARLIIKSAGVKDNWSCYWLNVNYLILFDLLVTMYNIMNTFTPDIFWDKFELG